MPLGNSPLIRVMPPGRIPQIRVVPPGTFVRHANCLETQLACDRIRLEPQLAWMNMPGDTARMRSDSLAGKNIPGWFPRGGTSLGMGKQGDMGVFL